MIRAPFQGVSRGEVRDSTVHRRSELYFDALRVIARDYANEELSLTRVARQSAAELLHDGRMSVQEVAAAVGYRQPAQFAKAFRRSHGAPPSSFRRSNGRLAA
jgi:AraC-like DNA-binding protein